MNKVYKYPIRPNSNHELYPIIVEAPVGAKPLHVGIQNGQVCLWVEVNPLAGVLSQCLLYCVGTGHGCIPDGYVHFQSMQEGPYVWHFYIKA